MQNVFFFALHIFTNIYEHFLFLCAILLKLSTHDRRCTRCYISIGAVTALVIQRLLDRLATNSLVWGFMDFNHYTPVLTVLLLRGGWDISQGNFIKRGTLGQKSGGH